MKVIHSDQPVGDAIGHSVFLAGPTPRGGMPPSWRIQAVELLEKMGYDGIVFVPERSDRTYKMDYTDQTEWEYAAIAAAKVVVFWVPRNMTNMPALTTNVEFGFWMPQKTVVYGRPDEAAHVRYLDWLIGREYPDAKIFNSLADTLAAAVAHRRAVKPVKTWITSDWHLGETRMKIMQRKFKSTEEQTRIITERFNALVSPDDIVLFNGDAITIQKNVDDMRKLLPCLGRFNGHKTLIRGNHDRPLTDDEFSPYFEQIIPDGGGIEAFVDGKALWVTHYPTQAREDKFNLVGHIHSAWKVQKNSLNVGVDVHSFEPVDLADVPFFIKAISEFYDNDVWVADLPANAKFATRGKPGRYLDVAGIIGG